MTLVLDTYDGYPPKLTAWQRLAEALPIRLLQIWGRLLGLASTDR